MQAQKQRLKQRRKLPKRRLVVASIAIILAIIGATIGILNGLGVVHLDTLSTIFLSIIIPILSLLLAFLQWLLPLSPIETGSSSPLPSHVSQTQQSNVQITFSQFADTQSLSPFTGKTTYRTIVGLPPPTNPRTIQQRENIVKEIYTKLIQPDVTALVLTGIDGSGKSILAALVYHYVEEQRLAGQGPFTAETLWIKIDPAVTMADLAGTLFESLGKPMPDLSRMAPQNQAAALFNALNTTDKPRLVLLDQFEKLLDGHTRHALVDRLGIDEWLDALNSQPCRCRILLTSQFWPHGAGDYPPICLQEYSVKPLEVSEGVELLLNQGVQATEEKLREAVDRCGGHALALMLLASLLRRNSSLSLIDLLDNPTYAQLWIGDIARNLLDRIYTQQLDPVERKLLLAFSVYREAVPLEAAEALIEFRTEVPKSQILSALDVLLAQHLLQALGKGRYQLQVVVASYAKGHFDESDERANLQLLQTAHAKSALYYVQQAATNCPPPDKRRGINDVHPLVEAIWQQCQAGMWKEAYILMEREGIFSDLRKWGGNAILLELCLQLLPLDKWHPEQQQAAHIYDNLGSIYNALGKKVEALKYYAQALDIFKEIGDAKGEGITLSNIGRVYSALGEKMEALRYYKRALSILAKIGEDGGKGTTLSHLGRVYSALGQQNKARGYYEQALGLLQNAKDYSGQGVTLSYLGRVYGMLGLREQALSYCEQALLILREIGDRRGEGRALDNLGRVYNVMRQYEDAKRSFEQALSIAREVGDRNGEGMILQGFGEVYYSLGQEEQSRLYYEQALSILKEVGDKWREGMTLNELGKISNDQGESEQAWNYYKNALNVRREVEDQGGEGTTLYNIGILYFQQHRYDVALACFLIARNIFREMQNPEHDKIEKAIDDLRGVVGKQRFEELLEQVAPQAKSIVEQALGEE